MKPAAAATLPAAIRLTPKKRRRRYSHGWIRRCRPGRGGVSHHPRRPFAAVLSLGAFIGMPPLGRGAGHPVTYQRDITLIGGLSMVAVLTGRLGGPRVGEVPYVARILRDHGRVMPGGPGVVPGPAELRDL